MHGSALNGKVPERMRPAIIALGANLGDRAETLNAALAAVEACGNKVLARSSFHETSPVGYLNQPDFLNAVALIGVPDNVAPEDFLSQLLAIEIRFGRERPFPNAPRTLDLDLIFFENEVRRTSFLMLPHPRWQERDFVKIPLREMFFALGERVPACFRSLYGSLLP